jgi:hypothetical protein
MRADQQDIVPEGHERAGSVVSHRAGVHHNQARRKRYEETWHLTATQRHTQDDPSTPVHAMELEDTLRDTKANRNNLSHDE